MYVNQGQISQTKINFLHSKLRTQSDFIDSARDIKAIIEYYANTTPDWPKDMKVYPYSLYYVFFEQYETIKGITLQNYMLSLTIVFCLVSVKSLVFV